MINLSKEVETTNEEVDTFTCGIVMPIASMGDYTASHWSDVQAIIKEAVSLAGYNARLVSESKDSTVIPKSIVQNLYDDEIIVCDVSGKNPNVMFELGMRLAFDKPIVLIKDSITGYSFDTSTIEHLEYPRDLRYSEILIFKKKLAEKIQATYVAASKEGYRSFLSNFATIKVAHLEKTTLSESQVLERILMKLDVLESKANFQTSPQNYRLVLKKEILAPKSKIEEFNRFVDHASIIFGSSVSIIKTEGKEEKVYLEIRISTTVPIHEAEDILQALKPLYEDLTEVPF